MGQNIVRQAVLHGGQGLTVAGVVRFHVRVLAPKERFKYPAPADAEATAPPPPATAAPISPSTAQAAPGATGGPGALRVNTASRRVWVGEQELTLTTKEFGVLALLDAERGSVVTRETLMATVWDENWFGSTKTLDVTMGRLRAKLEDAGADVEVVTVRGVGFRLEDDTCAPD